MATGELSFGLSRAILEDLRRVFAQYPEIQTVLVFGSRAKNTFQDGSDIDLAILAPALTSQRFTQLWDQLDSLPLVFKMDIVHWNTLENEKLKLKIMQEGKPLC